MGNSGLNFRLDLMERVASLSRSLRPQHRQLYRVLAGLSEMHRYSGKLDSWAAWHGWFEIIAKPNF